MSISARDGTPRWCVVLPAYNEEENLGYVLDDVLSMLSEIGAPHEVIVVDDGSRDRTGAIADEYARRHEAVRVIHHPANKGFGGALATGYANASGDLVVVIPSDRQFQCRDLKRCLPLLDDHDVVVCVRRDRHDTLPRRIASGSYRTLMRWLFGLALDDINWVKIYRVPLIQRIQIESEGPFIDTEILVRAGHMGARIAQVDVPHYPRVAGRATGASLRAMLKTFVDLFRLHRRLERVDPGKWPAAGERKSPAASREEGSSS